MARLRASKRSAVTKLLPKDNEVFQTVKDASASFLLGTGRRTRNVKDLYRSGHPQSRGQTIVCQSLKLLTDETRYYFYKL